VSARTAIDLVAVAQAHRRRVPRQLLEAQTRLFPLLVGAVGADELTLEGGAALCIALHDHLTLLLACDLRLLAHVRSALLSAVDFSLMMGRMSWAFAIRASLPSR